MNVGAVMKAQLNIRKKGEIVAAIILSFICLLVTHIHTHTHRTLSFSRSLARSLWLPRSQTPVIFRAKYQPYVRLGYLLRYTMTALHFASLLHGLNQSAWHCGAEDEEGTRIVHVRQSTKQTYMK